MPSVHPFPALNRPALLAITSAAALSIFSAGCHRKQQNTDVVSAPPPKPKPTVSEIDLKSYHPNEAGAVMILMYHRFDPKLPSSDKYYNRRPDDFRQDLEDLYKRGYRPVTVSQFIDNQMDLPAGKSPVVLTFDDSWDSQFKLVKGTDGQEHIDPDCAVGILETFQKNHTDWKSNGTFFVLPHEGRNPEPFYQPESAAEKMAYLLKNGYEIQNHTSTHTSVRFMAGEKIQWEISSAIKDIKEISKDAQMDILALPYGQLPRKAPVSLLKQGGSGNTAYKNRAVLLAAYRPVASPITHVGKKTAVFQIAPFDPYHIERVKPAPEQAKLPGTFEYWLKWFDDNPTQRYVSDGNPAVSAYPKSLAKLVDTAAIKKQGKEPQPYSFSSSSGGGSLSVESGSSSSHGGGLSVEGSSSSGNKPRGGNLGVESSPRR